MAIYKMGNLLVNTKKSEKTWDSEEGADGTLHLSSEGNYWKELDGEATHLDERDAAEWLLFNGHDLPEDLEDASEDLGE
jgi:hypothetical protein